MRRFNLVPNPRLFVGQSPADSEHYLLGSLSAPQQRWIVLQRVSVARCVVSGACCRCMLHGVCCMLHGVRCKLHGGCCALRGVCCMLRVCCCSTAAQAQLEELQLGSANGHLEGLKDEAPLMAVSTSSDPTQSSLPQAVRAGRSYSFVLT